MHTPIPQVDAGAGETTNRGLTGACVPPSPVLPLLVFCADRLAPTIRRSLRDDNEGDVALTIGESTENRSSLDLTDGGLRCCSSTPLTAIFAIVLCSLLEHSRPPSPVVSDERASASAHRMAIGLLRHAGRTRPTEQTGTSSSHREALGVLLPLPAIGYKLWIFNGRNCVKK